MHELGQRIRHERMRMGLKQEELAERTGLSTPYVSAMERGIKVPSMDAFLKIANALQCSADQLLQDSLDVSYEIYASDLTHRIEILEPRKRNQITEILEILLRYADEEN